jgi:hypothetical protein
VSFYIQLFKKQCNIFKNTHGLYFYVSEVEMTRGGKQKVLLFRREVSLMEVSAYFNVSHCFYGLIRKNPA